MTKNLIKFFVQIVIVIGLYYLFAYYSLEYLYIVVAAVALVLFILFNRGKTRNLEMYIDIAVDAPRYLETVDKLFKEGNNEHVYHLRKAYGLMYQGKYDESQQEFSLVQKNQLEDDLKFERMYHRIQAKLAFEQQDDVTLKAILDVITGENVEEPDDILINYVKLLLLLLTERYEEAVVNLMDNIPNQKARSHIIELEYYLAYAYNKEERFEDANAVVEFVVKKGYRIVYTDLCYELYISMKESNTENQ